jgi:trimeric autotransporter adhesin
MSTKTTFKRIALVAVAALGLGVISVAPSQATVISLTATSVNGTATTGLSDSTTAATIRITYTGTASNDSVTISSFVSGAPAGAAAIAASGIVVHLADTTTSTVLPVFTNAAIAATSAHRGDTRVEIANGANNPTGQVSANFRLYFVNAPATAGTYTITTIATPATGGTAGTPIVKTTDIVVTAADNNSTSLSTAHIGGSSVTVWGAETDTVSVVKANTATTTFSERAATIKITQLKANATAANESVTAIMSGPGVLGCGSSSAANITGRALTCHTDGSGVAYVHVFADGSSGTGTVSLTGTTSGYVFPSKKVLFSGTTIAKLTAAAVNSVVASAGNSKSGAVSVVATDKDGFQIYAPTVYVRSSATTILSNNYSTTGCTWDGTDLVTYCDVTPVAAGTANITFTNRASATATTPTTEVVSNAVAIRVGSTAPASAKLSFDKASYSPGEKATLTLTLLDVNGNAVAGSDLDNSTYANVWATGGITSDYAFYTGSDTLTATFAKISESTGLQTWTLYMPLQAAELTVKAVPGSAFPGLYQLANTATTTTVTAKATVGNSAGVDAATDAANEATDAANAATDAALAAADAADAATAAAQDASDAVAALSASVSKLISSLRAQITSLTNLVIKIQKKVRA